MKLEEYLRLNKRKKGEKEKDYYERLLSELIAKNLEMGEILIKTNDDLTIAKEEFTKADDNISILEKDLRKYLDFEKKVGILKGELTAANMRIAKLSKELKTVKGVKEEIDKSKSMKITLKSNYRNFKKGETIYVPYSEYIQLKKVFDKKK